MTRKQTWKRKSSNGMQKEPEEERKYSLKELKKLLNENNRHFCHEYVRNGWIKVSAYLTAYPTTKYQAAAASAHNLLKNTKIRQYIEYIKTDYEKICKVSKAKQIHTLTKIAYSSMIHYHNSWIELKDFENLTEEQQDAIESTETKTIYTETGTEIVVVKIKLYDKLRAIESINKMMGYNEPEKHEVKAESTISIDGFTKEQKKVLVQLSRQDAD